MGNINSRRATRSTSTSERVLLPPPTPTQLVPIILAIKEDWNDTAYVKKLILEKKLAPTPVHGQEIRDKECPICFLTFECLNSVACCKQNVCTDCFVQLKSSNAKCSCPFCGNDSFSVIFVPSSSPLVTPPKIKNINSSAGRGNFSRASTEVITPDSAASDKPSLFIPQSSKSDRDALEEQIKNQRQHYFDEDVALGRTLRSNSAAATATTSNTTFNFQRARTQQFGWLANAHSGGNDPARNALRNRLALRDGLGPFPPGSSEQLPPPPVRVHYSPRYRGGNEPALIATSTSSSTSSHATQSNAGPADHDRDLFMTSIQSLLGGEQLSGLDQLEELMLMEAIRLSMSDIHDHSNVAPESTTPVESVQASSNNDFVVSDAVRDTPAVDNALEEVDLLAPSRESDDVDYQSQVDLSNGPSFPQPFSSAMILEEDLADRDEFDDEDDESFTAAEFRSYCSSHKKRESRSSSGDSSSSDCSSVTSLLLPFRKLTDAVGSRSNGGDSEVRCERLPEERSSGSDSDVHLKNGYNFTAGVGAAEITLKAVDESVVPMLPVAARSGLYLHCRSPSEHLSKTSSHGSTDLSSSSSLLEKIQMALDSPAASRVHRSSGSSADSAMGIASMRCSPLSHDATATDERRVNCSVVTPDFHEFQPFASFRLSNKEHSSSFPELQGVATVVHTEEGVKEDGRRVFFIPQGEETLRNLQSSSVDEPLAELQSDFF